MGYAWQSKCFDTTTEALEAFKLSVPSVDAATINTFTTAPTINASGLVTWSISNRPLTTTTATTRTGTTQLPTCTPDSISTLPLQDLALVIGLVLCFLVGFRMGQAA